MRNKDLFNFELNVEEHLRDGKKKQTEDRDDGSNASIATKEESSKVSPQETYVKPKDDSLLDDIFADLVFENQAGSRTFYRERKSKPTVTNKSINDLSTFPQHRRMVELVEQSRDKLFGCRQEWK